MIIEVIHIVNIFILNIFVHLHHILSLYYFYRISFYRYIIIRIEHYR